MTLDLVPKIIKTEQNKTIQYNIKNKNNSAGQYYAIFTDINTLNV
jgi:hypothetical protein